MTRQSLQYSGLHTIKDIALVVAGLANVRRAVAVRNARTYAAVDPRVVLVVVVAVEAGSPAAVHAAAAAAAAPEAALATRQTAAHGRVQALVAAAAPRLLPGEGLEVLLVLGVDGAAVLQGRHLLAGLVEIALRLGAVVLLAALHLARDAALALLAGEDAAKAAA
jgi:hypothetical protein